MGYVCVKPTKVQNDSGQVEIRQPGESVPEAANWPNPGMWIKRGYIRTDDHETAIASGYTREKLLPMRESTDEDIARGAGTLVPKAGVPLPPGRDDPGGLLEDSDSKSELMSLSRADMESLATEHGVENASDYPNKGELADAILAATE